MPKEIKAKVIQRLGLIPINMKLNIDEDQSNSHYSYWIIQTITGIHYKHFNVLSTKSTLSKLGRQEPQLILGQSIAQALPTYSDGILSFLVTSLIYFIFVTAVTVTAVTESI